MKVSWSLPAIRDLEEIQDYIAERRPASAHRLISKIFGQTERLLSERPEIGRVGRVATTRELVITRTPYIVVYRPRTEIEILAVIHGKGLVGKLSLVLRPRRCEAGRGSG